MWKTVELKEITNNLDNRRIPLNATQRLEKEAKKLYPYIGANNIMGYIDEYIFDEKIICLAEDGGSWGKNQKCAVIYNEKVWVNNHAHVLTAKDNLILEYLMYYLNYSDLNAYINGATRGKLTQSSLNSILVPFPPLSEQKRITTILSAADEVCQKDKALVRKYEELAHALFLKTFGNPVSNPMGWEIKQLKSISTKIHSGNTPKGGSNVYVDKGITFFRSQNVWRNRLVLDDVAYLDKETHKKMNKSSLKNRDILMTKTGRFNTENSSLGRAALYQGPDDGANINGHVYLIRLQKNIINEFVLYILTTNEFREHIRRVCVGGIDKRQLNKEHLEEFPIIYPPIKLQEGFVEKLKEIEKQRNLAQASALKSEELFNGLLQKAFCGKL